MERNVTQPVCRMCGFATGRVKDGMCRGCRDGLRTISQATGIDFERIAAGAVSAPAPVPGWQGNQIVHLTPHSGDHLPEKKDNSLWWMVGGGLLVVGVIALFALLNSDGE
jgi:hypothetical protein